MSSMKHKFESAPEGHDFSSEQRVEIGQLKRSEAERKRVLAQFMEQEANEAQSNCRICSKIVYPVERIIAAKVSDFLWLQERKSPSLCRTRITILVFCAASALRS